MTAYCFQLDSSAVSSLSAGSDHIKSLCAMLFKVRATSDGERRLSIHRTVDCVNINGNRFLATVSLLKQLHSRIFKGRNSIS